MNTLPKGRVEVLMFDEKKLHEIKECYSRWEDGVLRKTLESVPELCEEFRTLSGIPVQRLYLPEQKDYMLDLGFPGEYPYIRGIYATGYRGRLWTMRQYAGYGTAKDTNRRYKYLLEQGQTGLSVAFDLPTQLGYDSDHPLSDGEVGKVGVAIDSLQDMEILFSGIPLDKVTTSMTINAPTNVLLAMYIMVAAKQGVTQEKLGGTVQNDIFKEYVARGNYIFPPEPSIRLVTEIFEYCAKHMPKWNSISISGYHMREAGCTAVQEVAFTLANGAAYVEAALQRGLQIDQFAPRLSFFFNSHMDFFEEIAKFRAARRMWARIMRERYGAKDARSWMLRFHAQTAGCSLTAQQPENNIIRTTLEALAAVLGGTQSLHTNSYDEAYATPTEKAVMIALRTQQIIAYESGIVNTVDPLAGSYFVERLTDEIEEQAMKYIERIRSMGEGEYPMLKGVIKGIETGFFQKEISNAAYRYQQEVESDARIVVGVNKLKMEEERLKKTLRVDEAVQRAQIERLKKLHVERDRRKVQDALEKLRKAAEGNQNLMYPMMECVGAYATIGEICDVMRHVFGEYQERTIFQENMEKRRIKVLIAKPGLDGHDRGAKVVARALHDAEMEVIYTGLHQTPEQIVEAAIKEDVDVIGLSILSGAHMTLFPKIMELLKKKSVDAIVFGGGIIPDEDIPKLKKLGITEIFTPGTTMESIVKFVNEKAGEIT